MKETGKTLISEIREPLRQVFVKPLFWSGLEISAREGFAMWASNCLLGGNRVSIRHGMTGKELATYSRVWGYKTKE